MKGKALVCNECHVTRSVEAWMMKFTPAAPEPQRLNPPAFIWHVNVGAGRKIVSTTGALVSEPLEFIASTQ